MAKNLDDLFVLPGRETSPDAQSVISLVRRWADEEIIGRRLEYQRSYDVLFPEKRRVLAVSMGLQKLAVPLDRGGFGWNSRDHSADVVNVFSEIGRADCSAGVALSVNYALFSVLSRFSESGAGLLGAMSEFFLKDELKTPTCILPGPGTVGQDTPLFKGRSVLARIEANADSAAVSGKGLRPIAAGCAADLFLTVCADRQGLTCLAAVPGDALGIVRGRPQKTTGLNALPNAEIDFDKVVIPAENLIRDPGAVRDLLAALNLFLGGISLGAGMNFFEILSDWSDSRTIKGSSLLKENPLCASVLADVAEELACAKLLLHGLALLTAPEQGSGSLSGDGVYTYAAMIGARVQQGVMRAINRGMELMGSAGYAKEWHAEKHWRDVKTIQSLLCGVAAEAPVKLDTARFFYDCTEI